MRFRDRRAAGSALGEKLRTLELPGPCVVLGLARGGAPVASAVSQALGAPLDVLVVRKVGVPGWEELAMGAVATGGVEVRVAEVLAHDPQLTASFPAAARAARAEVERREQRYTRPGGRVPLAGVTAVLVDDGVATGATMLAAVRSCRARGAARVLVATPVMAAEARALLEREADQVVALLTPEPFTAVAAWYEEFPQLDDEEVVALLAGMASAPPPRARSV